MGKKKKSAKNPAIEYFEIQSGGTSATSLPWYRSCERCSAGKPTKDKIAHLMGICPKEAK